MLQPGYDVYNKTTLYGRRLHCHWPSEQIAVANRELSVDHVAQMSQLYQSTS